MHFVLAGAILAIAAVWGVPILSSILSAITPVQAKAYLPSTSIPGITAKSVVTALVYGVLLVAALAILRAVGLKAGRI